MTTVKTLRTVLPTLTEEFCVGTFTTYVEDVRHFAEVVSWVCQYARNFETFIEYLGKNYEVMTNGALHEEDAALTMLGIIFLLRQHDRPWVEGKLARVTPALFAKELVCPTDPMIERQEALHEWLEENARPCWDYVAGLANQFKIRRRRRGTTIAATALGASLSTLLLLFRQEEGCEFRPHVN